MNPLVSIIIPVLNREKLIVETLDSVLAQTFQNWECLVVDDGSEDNTINVVKTYVNKDHRFRMMLRPDSHKAGGGGARNYGILKAQGKYVIFIDSDDLLAPSCLENRIRKFEEIPQNDFLVFRTQYFVEKVGDSKHYVGNDPEIIKDFLSAFLKYSLPWDTRGPIWKKSALEKLNYFDEDLDRLQDVDLHTSALIAGLKFRFHNIVDTYYRVETPEVKLEPSFFALKVLPSFARYYQKISKELNGSYLSDLQQGVMVTFKKYFLGQAKQNTKIIYRYITNLSNSEMISHKQRNVLNYLTLCYAVGLNKIAGHKNLIRMANKIYYN